MLLRNMHASLGLLNGTRAIVKELHRNISWARSLLERQRDLLLLF